MTPVRSNNVSLKYQRFTSSGCKDIGFTKTECVAETRSSRLAGYKHSYIYTNKYIDKICFYKQRSFNGYITELWY